MLMLGDVSFRISDQGEDSRNLGRWSYITLTGKNNATTTIFTCYCPCRSPGTGSAFVQQMLYMAIHKETLPDFDCPRQLFGYDLKIEIDKNKNWITISLYLVISTATILIYALGCGI